MIVVAVMVQAQVRVPVDAVTAPQVQGQARDQDAITEEADVAEAKKKAQTDNKAQTGDESGKTVRVTWVKSSIGYPKDQRATIVALGLHRLHETVEKADNPSTRGQIFKVKHLVRVEE
jgi:large subunit ribosomal protein L30